MIPVGGRGWHGSPPSAPSYESGRTIPAFAGLRLMAVIAKLGLLEHGRVRTDAGVFAVRPGDDGWFRIAGTSPEDAGRVRYHDERKLLEIERPDVTLSIHFLGETEKTTFEFAGRTCDIGTMDFGEILIREAGRPVVKGHSTVSGVRLDSVDPAFQPIERELAFGLALRSSGIDRELWRDDVVYPLRQYGL